MKYWCIAFFSWTLSLPSQAAEPFHLELVPTTCVTTEQQPICTIKLRLSITGGTGQQICLNMPDKPPLCQQHLVKTTSEFLINVETAVDLPITLTNSAGEVLKRTQLQLVRYQSPSKRHKRGYVWSLL